MKSAQRRSRRRRAVPQTKQQDRALTFVEWEHLTEETPRLLQQRSLRCAKNVFPVRTEILQQVQRPGHRLEAQSERRCRQPDALHPAPSFHERLARATCHLQEAKCG